MIRNAFAKFAMNACNLSNNDNVSIFSFAGRYTEMIANFRSTRDCHTILGRSASWRPWGESAYWLDIKLRRRSNWCLVRMDRNWKYSCFHYLEMLNEKKTTTTTTTTTNKVANHGSYNEMKAFFTVLQPQIALDYTFSRFDTITLLAGPCEINIWPKTDKLFSSFRFGWRFSDDFISFVTLQDLRNHLQEHQKLPWSRLEVDQKHHLTDNF